MSKGPLYDLEATIAELLDAAGHQRCTDLAASGAHGYRLVIDEARKEVRIGWIEARPGRSARTEQNNFQRVIKTPLDEKFGDRRLRRTAWKVRIVGKLRPVAGFAVRL